MVQRVARRAQRPDRQQQRGGNYEGSYQEQCDEIASLVHPPAYTGTSQRC